MMQEKQVEKPRRLRTDVAFIFSGEFITLILGVAITIVLARALGPTGRGVVAVAFNFTMILVQFGSFGLGEANLFFVARDKSKVPHIITNSIFVAVALGTVLVVLGILIKVWFPEVVAGVGWVELLVALGSLPGLLLILYLQIIFVGQKRVGTFSIISVVQSIISLTGLIIGFKVFHMHEVGALVMMGVSGYFGAGLSLALLLKDSYLMGKPDRTLAIEMFKYGFRTYAAATLAFLVIRSDIILVNAYLGAAKTGVYSVVAALAQGMYMLPRAAAINIFPRIASGEDYKLTAAVYRPISVLYGILCLITIPLVGPGINLLFGAEFDGATSLYYWILPGIYSLAMLNILSHHFAGRGFPWAAVVVWIPGLSLNILINVLFLAEFGTFIASLSSSISYTLILILHMHIFAKEAGGLSVFKISFRETYDFVRIGLSR